MVRDAYANYVVQTTLDVVPESEEKRLLLEELNLHSEELVREKLIAYARMTMAEPNLNHLLCGSETLPSPNILLQNWVPWCEN
jgi:hypothetical protein